MSDLVFNIAKGKAAYYATLPAANDALVVVVLQSSGLGTDATLRDLTTLTAVLGAATEQTTMGRKTISSGVAVSVDNTNDRTDVDITTDPVWSGATGAAVGALVVCYCPDTTSPSDSTMIPLTKHDFVVTPNGSDIQAQIAASGFYRAA